MVTEEWALRDGLSFRPASPADAGFLQSLHNSRRDDLRLVDGEPDFIEFLISDQQRLETLGHMGRYPNAQEYVVEKAGTTIGRVLVDIDPDAVHLVDIAFIPQARGQGYGASVVRALQSAVTSIGVPLSLCVSIGNVAARRLYGALGFKFHSAAGAVALMTWIPPQANRRVFI